MVKLLYVDIKFLFNDLVWVCYTGRSFSPLLDPIYTSEIRFSSLKFNAPKSVEPFR